MDWERRLYRGRCCPRGCHVPRARPRGAPRLTYGRSAPKAMDVFNLDHARWPELVAERARWRAMLQSGEAPAAVSPAARARAALLPVSHPSVRPRRAAAARTNAAIDASLRTEAQTTRLGRMKKS